MERRLLVIANIGFILGIIEGLYFKTSITLFLSIFVTLCIAFLYFNRFNHTVLKRIRRYCKLYITKKVLVIFLLFAILGILSILVKESKLQNFLIDMNNNKDSLNVQAMIIGNKETKEYSDMYKVKILSVNGKKYSNIECVLKVNKLKEETINYGDLISFKGEFQEPQDRSNYKGFSYKEYLKTINIYGTFKSKYSSIEVLKKNSYGILHMVANNAKLSIERTN